MDKFTKQNVNALSKELVAAMQKVCEEHGVEVSFNGGTFGNFESKLKIKLKIKSEAALEQENVMLDMFLRSEGVGKVSRCGNMTMTDYNTRAYKKPFRFQDKRQPGKTFICDHGYAKLNFPMV